MKARLVKVRKVAQRLGLGLEYAMLGTSVCACSALPDGAPAPPPLQQRSVKDLHRPSNKSPQTPPASAVATASTVEFNDVGPFSEWNQDLKLHCPDWLGKGPFLRALDPRSNETWLAIDGQLVCPSNTHHQSLPLVTLDPRHLSDLDNDGIPDPLDLLRGAKKTVLNAANYKSVYRALDYPGGDVPTDEGVCTDVVVRALRNVGWDLQVLMHEDIQKRPLAYPWIKKADPHIDHRRVRTLLPWFKDNAQVLSIDPLDTAFPFLPGDILFMSTIGDAEPEHMGIVSDRAGRSGFPLVINNWNDGTKTAEMDLLKRVPVTHRFRMGKAMVVQGADQGLGAMLARLQLSIPAASSQMIAVTTPLFDSSGGTLTRWEWLEGHLKQVGKSVAVRTGRAGLGQGRGLHRVRLTPKEKQEGDGRAPAGIFFLGTAFGRPTQRPYSGLWPYRAVTPRDFWVDEPSSPDYNSWQELKPGVTRPWSAEALSMYSLGLVVDHNLPHPKPGAGSAIFLHPWKGPQVPTVGCTAMAPEDLTQILAWLDPSRRPLLVQVAGQVF